MRPAGVLAVALIGVTGLAESQTVRLATSPPRGNVTLLLGAPPAALVEETRRVDLPAGETSLVLSWQGTRLNADSLELAPADASVQVAGPVLLADQPQHAQWTLTSPAAKQTELALRYLMDGLTWEPEYVLVLNGATVKASLAAVALVKNDSGEDYKDARVDLGLSAAVPADLETGSTLRLPYVNAAEVAYELLYLCDRAASPDVLLRLDLENTEEAGLGLAPLPAGKLRLYEEQGGDRLLTGEVKFPYTPVGARAELVLGTAREVSVERRVVRVVDVNVRKDVHGRVALLDREEEIAFAIESLKDQDVRLKIVETIDGDWEMLSNSHEFEKKDANHLEFVVPVSAHSKLTVKYKVRRLDVLP